MYNEVFLNMADITGRYSLWLVELYIISMLTFGVDFLGYFKWCNHMFSFSGLMLEALAILIFGGQTWCEEKPHTIISSRIAFNWFRGL